MYFVFMKNEKPTNVITSDTKDCYQTIGDALTNGDADQIKAMKNVQEMMQFWSNAEKPKPTESDSETPNDLLQSILEGFTKGIETVFTQMAKDAAVKKVIDAIFKPK
jgi:hypothetical protein